jgi:hypothetical protein
LRHNFSFLCSFTTCQYPKKSLEITKSKDTVTKKAIIANDLSLLMGSELSTYYTSVFRVQHPLPFPGKVMDMVGKFIMLNEN